LKSIAHERQLGKRSQASPATAASTGSIVTQPPDAMIEKKDDITESMRLLSIKSQTQAIVTGTFGALVASFLDQEPGRLTFKPEDETQPVALNNLPEEILVEIIHLLDPTSIERFAAVSKMARVVTLESSIWR
jgi:F-box protein 9